MGERLAMNDSDAVPDNGSSGLHWKKLAIFFSSGDLGDVGRHAVAAALEWEEVVLIKAFAHDAQSMLLKKRWRCGCPSGHSVTQRGQDGRLDEKILPFEMTFSVETIAEQLHDIDAVLICMGNRQIELLHPECISMIGAQSILQAAQVNGIRRVILLSSVGISEDWPPMEWSPEGRRLESLFRTVCWPQFQDLTGAERAIQTAAQENTDFDFLIVRTVLLIDTVVPCGTWLLQMQKYESNHPSDCLAKMDCARFMVQEAIRPTIHNRAVTIGGLRIAASTEEQR